MRRLARRLVSPESVLPHQGAPFLSVLALTAVGVRLAGDGWRLFLLFTVVLMFVQFLGLLRRFER
ncbi:MAG: hypothetical protein NTZ05_11290 [Chloroflexi bacterium]|nr:hypothetical protein [Chloroflexota bacterium]